MTICVAIKFGQIIYMAADSMVTGKKSKHPMSAAGEKITNHIYRANS